jgi:hypothetical protein
VRLLEVTRTGTCSTLQGSGGVVRSLSLLERCGIIQHPLFSDCQNLARKCQFASQQGDKQLAQASEIYPRSKICLVSWADADPRIALAVRMRAICLMALTGGFTALTALHQCWSRGGWTNMATEQLSGCERPWTGASGARWHVTGG